MLKQFLYISLICGLISGFGIFIHIPHDPSVIIPSLVAFLGVISAFITIKDKSINIMLKLGGIMIKVLPLYGSIIMRH